MPDPVFLITGASSGIGAATARRAAEAGYRVVLSARSEERLRALADALGGPERALAVRCDVTEWEDQQAMVEETLARFGQRPSGALEPDDVARTVMFAVSQPPHVDVNEILVRPTAQPS